MYLTTEQRFNIAMRMLGIVERIAFERESAIKVENHTPRAANDDGDDEFINDMIREQLKVSDSNLMNDGVDDE